MKPCITLSLSGGGERGKLYAKFIPLIQKRYSITMVYGVSIGSIVGLAILTCVNLDEMFSTQEFNRLFTLCMDYGNPLRNAITRVFTMGNLSTSTRFRDFPGLCVNACIQGKPSVVYMSSVCNSDITVFDAVYASCCVPMLFEPLVYKGLTLFDGGVLENLIVPDTSCNDLTNGCPCVTPVQPKCNKGVTIGLYLEPVAMGQWFVDSMYTYQYLWLVKYSRLVMPVFMLGANTSEAEFNQFLKSV